MFGLDGSGPMLCAHSVSLRGILALWRLHDALKLASSPKIE
jgi:hypothetical protein